LDGAAAAFSPEETTVVANTGDDIELGGLFVSPDVDTLLFQGGGILDRETWWGIEGDTHRTNSALLDIATAAGFPDGPQYLPRRNRPTADGSRTGGAFGVAEFMTIGDRDRAVHITRTSLLDEGKTLSEATERLASAFGLTIDLFPMSDDPVASLVHTDEGLMHFQEYWVAHRGEPTVDTVEFRGSSNAEPAPGVLEALSDTVVIGPSNPVTSIGPMLALPGVADALAQTTVIAVSPFLGDDAFSGPAGALMAAVNAEPSTEGLATAYPFADAFVIDAEDDADFDRPTIQTDIKIDSREDAARVVRAVDDAIDRVS